MDDNEFRQESVMPDASLILASLSVANRHMGREQREMGVYRNQAWVATFHLIQSVSGSENWLRLQCNGETCARS